MPKDHERSLIPNCLGKRIKKFCSLESSIEPMEEDREANRTILYNQARMQDRLPGEKEWL